MTTKPTGYCSRQNFYITPENYAQLVGSGSWAVNDLPPEQWKQIRKHFDNPDTLAVFASGSLPTPIQPPSRSVAAAGIDWVRIETDLKPRESALNVYHYIIGSPDQVGYPGYGPFKSGAMAEHWSNLEDLGVYLANEEE
jgi:hypothetical protein